MVAATFMTLERAHGRRNSMATSLKPGLGLEWLEPNDEKTRWGLDTSAHTAWLTTGLA